MIERSHIWGAKISDMHLPTTDSKLVQLVDRHLKKERKKFLKRVARGKVRKAERRVRRFFQGLCDVLLGDWLGQAADRFTEQHEAPRGSHVQVRSHQFRLASGRQVGLRSPYYRHLPEGYTGGRRPLLAAWGCPHGNSGLLTDRIAMAGVLCPSYDLGSQLVKRMDAAVCTSSVRKITNQLADRCERVGQAELVMEADETLAGKRVVISMDGGRTRLREASEDADQAGKKHYATPWREPKLFVIDVLDEQGGVERSIRPLYGARFDEEQMLDLLKSYLAKLHIDQAAHVQVIADGALWIWNRVPVLLRKLGVKESRLTQTLDHYHALQYVHDLVKAMPKKISDTRRTSLLNEFKQLLWNGKSGQIVTQLRAIFRRPTELVERWINYLDKHQNRTQYADYEQDKLMCGSGLMESAVRRIINLRYKNASTFWLRDKVEKLYFLRGAFLANRWDTVLKNLEKLQI